MDDEDGYHKENMLFPQPGEAIIDPIALLNASSLRVIQCSTSGRRKLDQSVIMYSAPKQVKPKVGEKQANF